MSVNELESCPSRFVVVAERVEDGRLIEEAVIGRERAEELYSRWDGESSLRNLRVFVDSHALDDVSRSFEHDWPPTGNEPQPSSSSTAGWDTR